MADFRLQIVTHQKAVFDQPVTSLTMPGADGSFGVWANHRSIIAVLQAGRVELRTGSTVRTFTIGDGFFEMDKNEATLLTDKIEGLALATDDEE